jgi:hypothetical protein
MPLVFASPVAFTVIDAVRYWRLARDQGQPVQPALFTRLGMTGSGLLAPVLDGLLRIFEAAFRRRFEAGAPADNDLTDDEQWLVDMLEDAGKDPPAGARPDLVAALRIAVRSTRVMLRSVLAPLQPIST